MLSFIQMGMEFEAGESLMHLSINEDLRTTAQTYGTQEVAESWHDHHLIRGLNELHVVVLLAFAQPAMLTAALDNPVELETFFRQHICGHCQHQPYFRTSVNQHNSPAILR